MIRMNATKMLLRVVNSYFAIDRHTNMSLIAAIVKLLSPHTASLGWSCNRPYISCSKVTQSKPVQILEK